MYNYILSAGLTVVAAGAFDHNVDIESNAGRQLVYRGLRAWQRDVFAANERGLISELEKVRIFSEVKTVAVDNYNIAREELVNNVVEETIVVIDEVAELKAQLAAMQAASIAREIELTRANNVLSQDLIETKKTLVSALDKIDNLKSKNLVEVTNRTMLVGRTITNVQVSTPVVI